jgi:hypothetical protein
MLKEYGALFAVGAGAVLILAYFAKKGVTKGLTAAAHVAETKLNPYSNQNIIYDGVIGGAGRAITGGKNWSLGGALYDLTH